MVKTGAERAEKYALKYDDKALMLRWKALRDWSIEKFRAIAFKQYLVQYVANKLYEDYEILYELTYGQKGCMFDKIQKILFQYDTLTEADLAVLKEDWIREGLPEAAFNELPDLFESIKPLFEVCVYPTSKLFSKITLDPEPYLTVFPEIEDYIQLITPLEQEETLYLHPERKEVSILETKVCAHNTVKAIPVFFDSPTIDVEVIAKEVTFDISVSYHIAYKEEPTLNIGVVKS